MLGFLAARTERIALGSALMQIPARRRRPPRWRRRARRDSGGRFRLGLGVSGPQVSEGWYGVPFTRPLARTREYVEIIRLALGAARPLEYAGRESRSPMEGGTGLGKPLKLLARPVQERIPIYLGAIGPKAVEQVGAIADGWLPFMFDPAAARGAAGAAARGADGRGASLADIDVAPSSRSAVDDDLEDARDAVRPWLAFYLGAMGAKDKNFYVELAERVRLRRAGAAVQALWLARRPGGGDGGPAGRPDRRDGARVHAGRLDERLAAYEARGRRRRWSRSPAATTGRASCARWRRRRSGRRRCLSAALGRTASRARRWPGPYPGRRLRRSSCATELRELARVQLFGEVVEPQGRAARRSTSSCATAAARCRARCGATTGTRSGSAAAGRRRPGRRRRRLRLLPRLAHVVAGVLLRRRPTLRVAGEGDLLAQLDAAAAAARAPRACSSRRSAWRGRRCRAASASSRARAARRATTCSPGCAGAAGPGALVWAFAPVQDRHAAPRDHPRAAGPRGGAEEVEVDRRRARRRLAGRPVRVLRRDAVPDRRDAARAGHRVGRPPHRPHADRRRRRRVRARRRRTPPRPPCPSHCARGARGAARRCAARLEAQGAAGRRRAAPARWRRCRARPPRTSRATAPRLHQQLRELRARGPRARRRARDLRPAPSCSTAGGRAARGRRARRLARPAPRARPRGGGRTARGARPRTARARAGRARPAARRSSAATRSSRTPTATPVTSAAAARSRAAHDRPPPRRHRARPPVAMTGSLLPPEGAGAPEASPDLRDRLRADRGDHPPAGLRRGRAARDARPLPRGPRAGRVLRLGARGRRRRASRSCASTSSSRGSRPAARHKRRPGRPPPPRFMRFLALCATDRRAPGAVSPCWTATSSPTARARRTAS